MARFETEAIRQQMRRTPYREHASPLFLTSSFVFDNADQMAALFNGEAEGDIYSRYSNPNVNEFVDKVCAMEGAEDGFATASGMAAVWAGMAALLHAGDHVIASRAVFGSTHQILTQVLPRWGITHTYVDPTDVEGWEAHIRPETRMIVLETPSNPGLTLVDLEQAGALARKYQLVLLVDNCFATPYLQRPIDFGADLVMHSATKFMDGQGRVLGGVLVGRKELIEEVRFFCRHTGPALAPFNAWVLSKGLETLAVRMEQHCTNAHALAEWLEQHPSVARVAYPFLPSHSQYALAKKQMKRGGALVAFEIKGGLSVGKRFIDALQLCSRSSNLGDVRTIVTHPASTTHSKLSEKERLAVGITPGLIRISVGLEHIDDIQKDIEQALAQASG